MDVNVYGVGPNSSTEQQVDTTFGAARVSLRPTDYTVPGGPNGGHYKISAATGIMAAGITTLSQIFQARWADPTKLMIVQLVRVQACTGTGFAATSQGCPLDLIIGHGSTANGSGGSALTVTSASNKMRSGMASSAFATSGEIRVATTAALTAATNQTLEPNPIGICAGAPNATLQQGGQYVLFETSDAGDHPLILQSGDTLAVRANNPAATGTWYAYITLEWLEAVNF